MTRGIALLSGLLLVAPLAGAHAQEGAAAVDSLALAQQYTAWLYDGAADSLIAHSSEGAKESFSTAERWAQYSETILQRGGIEIEVVEETWKLRNGQCQYWRTANFSGMEEALLIRWVLNEEGEIAAVGLGPASQPPMVDNDQC